MPSLRRFPLALLVGWLVCGPSMARAQRFGQWSWDAFVGVGQRQNETLDDSGLLSTYDQRRIRTILGLNGFILHPHIGQFRLALSTLASRSKTPEKLTNQSWGASGELVLFPYNHIPMTFHAAHNILSYDGLTQEETQTFGIPSSVTSWGGTIKIRRGFLPGLRFATDYSLIKFEDPGINDQLHENQVLSWATSSGKARHRIVASRRKKQYGIIPLTTEDWTLDIQEHLELGKRWTWDLFNLGILRDTTYETEEQTTNQNTDLLQLQNRLNRTFRKNDIFSLGYSLGLTRNNDGATAQGHSSSVSYSWTARENLRLTPSLSFAFSRFESRKSYAPGASLAAIWNRNFGPVDLVVNGNVSYNEIRRDTVDGTGKESSLGFGTDISIRDATGSKLNKELSILLARNELRINDQVLTDLPDLGISTTELSLQDQVKIRLTMDRQWGRARLSSYLDWQLLRNSGGSETPDFTRQTWQHNLNLDWRLLTLSTTGNLIYLRQEESRKIASVYAFLGWKPWRRLRTKLYYRYELREFDITSASKRDRFGASLAIGVGDYSLNGSVYYGRDAPGSDNENIYQGFSWTISRRFAGWLPFISNVGRRRGVIL